MLYANAVIIMTTVNKASSVHARGRGQHCTRAIHDMIHFCYYKPTSVSGIYIDMLFTLK